MFYSQFILAKKGPLGTIWIAAHLERKLRKNQVTETNISLSVDSILFPEVPIALRLSGHLLLGVVRIYSRKVNYLFNDCSEALAKIKTAFHAGAVDLPPEAATAPFHSITLPETFDLDEFEPLLDRELDLLHASSVDHHVSSREQITLQDPLEDNIYLGSQFGLDERFPEADAPRMGLDFDEDLLEKTIREGSPVISTLQEDEELPLEEDIIPVTRMDDEMDFDQMDRMDTMDMEDHHEPVTPGLGLDDQMDLDYQNDEVENDRLERGPDELEQLEPDLEMDDLHASVKDPHQLEPATPGTPQLEPEQEDKDELAKAQGEGERSEKAEEEVEVDKQDEEARLDNGDEQDRLESLDEEGGFQKQDEQDILEVQAEQGTPEKESEQGTLEEQDEQDTLEKQDEEGILEKQDEEGILEKQDEEASVERQEEASKSETGVLEGEEGRQGEDYELEKQEEGGKLSSLDVEVGIDVHGEGETTERKEGEENLEQQGGEEILKIHIEPEGENLEIQLGSAEVDVTQDVNELDVNRDWTETQKLNDVPDFEIVMSAPDAVNRESDVFDLDIDMEKPVSPMGFQDKDQVMEDVDPLLQEEYIPGIGEEDAQAGMGNELSPLRSPPFPDMGGDDMPGDDDVLASLLGRATPALKVMPTPPVKPAPKPRRKQRKRKVVMDMVTIIGADVMKQQLMNTDDIRRVRRKAPCTCRELWAVQQAERGTRILHEPSMPGLCEELHSLFTRVYVHHMDEEQPASPLREDIVAGEEIQEPEVPTTHEDLNIDVNEMAEQQGDYVLVEEGEMQFAADEQRQSDGQEVAEGGALDVAEDETALAQSHVPPQDPQSLASPRHLVEQEEEPAANYTQDEEALPGFEGETKDGSRGLGSPVAFEATSKDADLATDIAEEKPQEEEAVQLDSVLVHEEVEAEGEGKAIQVEAEAEAEAEAMDKANLVETEVDEGQVLPEGEVVMIPVGEDIVTSEADATAMPVVDVEGEAKAGIQIGDEVGAGNETTAEALVEIEASAEAEAVPDGQPGDEPLEVYQEDGERLRAREETLEVVPLEGEVDVAIPSSPVGMEGSPAAAMDFSHDASMEVAADAAVEADAKTAAMAAMEAEADAAQAAMEAEADAAQAAMEAEAAMEDAPATPIDDSLDVPLIALPAEEEPENEAFGFLGDTRDTEFLGADDDELEEEADEFQDTNDYGRKESFMQDNSGWSSRTRAVGQYLRTSLEDLDTHMRRRQEDGTAKLSLDRMLIGKTKKEAARMFFETLVLKTKDYIHIEQNTPYGDIHISAGLRLPKAKF